MKKKTQTSKIGQAHQDQSLKLKIEQEDKRIIAYSRGLGIEHARKNIPSSSGEINPCRESIRQSYEEMAATTNSYTQSDKHLVDGTFARNETKRKNEKLQIHEQRLRGEVEAKECEDIQAPNKKILNLKTLGLSIFILLVWAGEFFLIKNTLEQLGDTGWANMFLSISVSASLIAVAHLTNRLLKKIRSPKFKVAVAGGVTLVVGGALWTLCYIRSEHFKGSATDLHILGFVSISLIIFLALFFAVEGLFSLIQQYKEYAAEMKKQKDLDDTKNALLAVQDEIEQNETDLSQQNAERISHISYGKSLQELIKRKYQKAMAIYIETNRKNRTIPFPSMENIHTPELNIFYTDIKL